MKVYQQSTYLKWKMVYIANFNPDISSSCDKTELAVSESFEPSSTVCSSEDMDRVDMTVSTILSKRVTCATHSDSSK